MKIRGIVMGLGAAQATKAGKKTWCSIILTKELGFIRIYNIPANEKGFNLWRRMKFEIEEGNDTRKESYRYVNHRAGELIKCSLEKRMYLDATILETGGMDPIKFQNQEHVRQSIALVKLNHGDCEYRIGEQIPKNIDCDGEFGWITSQKEFQLIPKLWWRSCSGSRHNTHLGGRDVYEGLRNLPDTPFRIFENLQLGPNSDFDHWMLLGNQNKYKRSFLCVTMFRFKKTDKELPKKPIFKELPPEWPYGIQGKPVIQTPDLFNQ